MSGTRSTTTAAGAAAPASTTGAPTVVAAAAPVPSGVGPAWPMYRAMVGIGLLCGLAIVTVFELTRPVIARNQAAALERAVFHVLPEAASSVTFYFAGDGFESVAGGEEAGDDAAGGERVWAGYDADGGLVGLAIETRGMGYQDTIRLLYGYAPEQDAVVGIRVLESKETPGLGDKIETDPGFLENFVRLEVALTADGASLANPIEVVKQGEKTEPWQIDGITGATISAVAVGDMLRRSTEVWIPRLSQRLDDFAPTAGPPAAPAAAPPVAPATDSSSSEAGDV